MSRNMIDANSKFFTIVKDFISQCDETSPYPLDAQRYIKTDASEKEWLKELNIIKTYDLTNIRFATIEFQDKEYFVAIGLINSVDFENILNAADMNAGIYTALISELKIAIKKDANPYEIFDRILYLYKKDDNDYAGHDFSVFSDFFEPILFYRIDDNSPHNSESIFNIIGYFLSKNYSNLYLIYSSQTIFEFEKLFIEGGPTLPYENLIHSLTSVQWKYSFLDCYRCLENLFPLIKLDELHQKLQVNVSLLEFASEIERIMNWKPKEDISIQTIIDSSPVDAINLLKDVKEFIDGDREGQLGYSFYKIRNSIVHFRPATINICMNPENWDKLIKATLKIIRYWYNIFEPKLQNHVAKPNG